MVIKTIRADCSIWSQDAELCVQVLAFFVQNGKVVQLPFAEVHLTDEVASSPG